MFISTVWARRARWRAAALAACLVAAPAGAQDPAPGATDPIGDPRDLTLFPSQDIAVLGATNYAAHSELQSYSATSSKLDNYKLWSNPLPDGGLCTTTPRRRLTSGRVLTPMRDQAICATPFGFDILSDLVSPTARVATYHFASPGHPAARGFDVAAGDLRPDLGSSDMLHQEVAAAYRDYADTLHVEVVDYTGKQLAHYSSGDAWTPRGDVALTLGDFDDDQELEVLIAADVSTGRTGPGSVLMEVLDFTASVQGPDSLALKSRRLVHIDSPPNSLVLEAADYLGQGHDQVVLGFYRESSDRRVTLQLYDLGGGLKLEAPLVTQQIGPSVAANSYFALAPGLFRLDPSHGFDLHRSELALAAVDSDGAVIAKMLTFQADPPALKVTDTTTLSRKGETVLSDGVGPGLAAGNLVGLQTEEPKPIKQMMVTLPVRAEAAESGASYSYPSVIVASLDQQSLRLQVDSQIDLQNHKMYGVQYAQPVTALDRTGRSFYLGDPAHITVAGSIDPQTIVQMPPKHVDYLPVNPDDPGSKREVVNVSGLSGYYVELKDSQQKTLKQTATDTVSSTFGAGTTQSVTGTVSAGSMELLGIEASTTVKTAFNYETTSVQSRENTNYKSVSTQRSAQTNLDDRLIYNMRWTDIWRYPVYGLDLRQSDQYPFYELVLPGKRKHYRGNGRQVGWYNPRHSNNNVLSYPAIDPETFPSDLGSFTPVGGTKAKTEPLNEREIRTFGGNAETFSLSWTESAGETKSKKYDYTMSSSTDITVGAKAGGKIRGIGGSVSYEGTVSFHTKSSWSTATVSQREISESTGITLVQPGSGSAVNRAYQYQTLVYISDTGGLKVAHATDVTKTEVGSRWWRKNYARQPDPALNLPLRFTYDESDGSWHLTQDAEIYHSARGIAVLSEDKNPATGQYDYLTGGVEEGTNVRVQVHVHNYALEHTAERVTVAFAVQKLDSNGDPVGKPQEFARTAPFDLKPLASAVKQEVWQTAGMAHGDSGTPYRFVITVDPNDQVRNELHELGAKGGNNRGHWPWDQGFYVLPKKTPPEGVHPNLLAAAKPTPEISVHIDAPRIAPEHLQDGRAPRVDVVLHASRADRDLRHFKLSHVDPETGEKEVLAARALHGIAAGRTRLSVPLVPEHVHRLAAGGHLRLHATVSESHGPEHHASDVMRLPVPSLK